MRRSSRVKYLVPTDNPELVKPGFLYIRRTSRGKEFVRNRKAPEDEMCPNCRRSSTRATSLAQKEAELDAQIAKLQAQLELSREQEQQERVGFRKPQPYLYTRAAECDQEETTPPPEIIDAVPSPSPSRRVSFDPEPRVAYYRARRQHRQHNDHARRSSHYATHQDRQPTYTSDDYEYQTYDEHPPTAYRTCSRSSHRRPSRQYQYHEGIPLLFQRIITGGRRRRSNGCRRASRPYVVQYPEWQYESRSPEDYWY